MSSLLLLFSVDTMLLSPFDRLCEQLTKVCDAAPLARCDAARLILSSANCACAARFT